MRITSTLTFTAAGDRVADMLVNPDFAQFVGTNLNAVNTTTSAIDGGLTTVMTLVSPDGMSVFLGAHMSITQTTTWEAPLPDHTRTGRMTLSVAGMPAFMDGVLNLTPAPTGCVVVYDADFTVRIPLLGKKAEMMAEGYMERVLTASERLGNQWLMERDATSARA
ncbi:MAG: DUF2505 domain-containing protein [Propionibacteriaceae bacterium]|nr:DUF2505 domain-containing protein [Propionibacteriaceae bacterium]